MTDPETLTKDELILYVKQLQHIVLFWQNEFAYKVGTTREQLLENVKGGPLSYSP